MDEAATVQVFESFGQLVNDVLFMDILEQILTDNLEQVCLNILQYHVEVFSVFGFYGFVQFYDIGVLELL